MLEVSANPPPLFPMSLSYPIPAGYGTAPSLGPVFSPFSSVPSSLIMALHFPLAASFSAGYCHLPRHHHLPQERDTGASRPGQGWVPTLPWAESLVALGTAAWPQEQGYCMTSAGGVLSPPPDCTS